MSTDELQQPSPDDGSDAGFMNGNRQMLRDVWESGKKYISGDEARELAANSGLSFSQVKNWFDNQRKQLARKIRQSGGEPERTRTSRSHRSSANYSPAASLTSSPNSHSAAAPTAAAPTSVPPSPSHGRHVMTPQQRQALEAAFKVSEYIAPATAELIANKIGVDGHRVVNWFKAKRARVNKGYADEDMGGEDVAASANGTSVNSNDVKTQSPAALTPTASASTPAEAGSAFTSPTKLKLSTPTASSKKAAPAVVASPRHNERPLPFNGDQTMILRQAYTQDRYVSAEQVPKLAVEINAPEARVRNWFKNTRAYENERLNAGLPFSTEGWNAPEEQLNEAKQRIKQSAESAANGMATVFIRQQHSAFSEDRYESGSDEEPTFAEIYQSAQGSDGKIPHCEVCCEPGKRLVRCKTCNIFVHERCYGVDLEDTDTVVVDWECEACAASNHQPVTADHPKIKCWLCNTHEDRSFIRDKDKRWVHPSCSEFIPVNDNEEIAITSCDYCDVEGATVACDAKNQCAKVMHVTCGFRHDSTTTIRDKSMQYQFFYCRKHRAMPDRDLSALNSRKARIVRAEDMSERNSSKVLTHPKVLPENPPKRIEYPIIASPPMTAVKTEDIEMKPEPIKASPPAPAPAAPSSGIKRKASTDLVATSDENNKITISKRAPHAASKVLAISPNGRDKKRGEQVDYLRCKRCNVGDQLPYGPTHTDTWIHIACADTELCTINGTPDCAPAYGSEFVHCESPRCWEVIHIPCYHVSGNTYQRAEKHYNIYHLYFCHRHPPDQHAAPAAILSRENRYKRIARGVDIVPKRLVPPEPMPDDIVDQPMAPASEPLPQDDAGRRSRSNRPSAGGPAANRKVVRCARCIARKQRCDPSHLLPAVVSADATASTAEAVDMPKLEQPVSNAASSTNGIHTNDTPSDAVNMELSQAVTDTPSAQPMSHDNGEVSDHAITKAENGLHSDVDTTAASVNGVSHTDEATDASNSNAADVQEQPAQ